MFLFPRLAGIHSENMVHNLQQLGSPAEAASVWGVNHPHQTFGQTGGHPVSPDRLQQVRERIIRLAHDSGYPGRRTTDAQRAFDRTVTRYLCTDLGMPTGEALRGDTWAFMTMVLLPDVAVWRWPERSRARLVGGNRNCFQRLWLRGRLLELGEETGEMRWQLVDRLTEDAFTQLIERPGVTSFPSTARTLGREWVGLAGKIGDSKMEALFRQVMTRVRAESTIVALEAMDEADRDRQIRSIFTQEAVKAGLLSADTDAERKRGMLASMFTGRKQRRRAM